MKKEHSAERLSFEIVERSLNHLGNQTLDLFLRGYCYRGGRVPQDLCSYSEAEALYEYWASLSGAGTGARPGHNRSRPTQHATTSANAD
jgi:hypothetical protein